MSEQRTIPIVYLDFGKVGITRYNACGKGARCLRVLFWPFLLIAPITSIFKHEISELSFAAHNVKNDYLSFRVAVENATGATYDLAIAITFKLQWNFTGGWVPLKTLDGREHSLYKRTCRRRVF